MAWIIDKDFIAGKDAKPKTNCNAVGIAGPAGYEGDKEELTFHFRMYDDDGGLSYEGRSDGMNFDPLDDFGSPNAGCTYIQYKNSSGDWETL